jgi:hypothetical protein
MEFNFRQDRLVDEAGLIRGSAGITPFPQVPLGPPGSIAQASNWLRLGYAAFGCWSGYGTFGVTRDAGAVVSPGNAAYFLGLSGGQWDPFRLVAWNRNPVGGNFLELGGIHRGQSDIAPDYDTCFIPQVCYSVMSKPGSAGYTIDESGGGDVLIDGTLTIYDHLPSFANMGYGSPRIWATYIGEIGTAFAGDYVAAQDLWDNARFCVEPFETWVAQNVNTAQLLTGTGLINSHTNRSSIAQVSVLRGAQLRGTRFVAPSGPAVDGSTASPTHSVFPLVIKGVFNTFAIPSPPLAAFGPVNPYYYYSWQVEGEFYRLSL